ncbi:MAG: ATP-dependent DNA helicase RecQ [Sodalis sp. (in: enterobacteria)]|uniref:ATP-dependent DNA helicase RecQ n=1 Tax=Sodalis sp. (in: enterobacteria) TaxID=1898979 RepID=UPI0039E545B8
MSTAEIIQREALAEQVLHDTFGYQQFRPGQQAIIHAVLSGRDCLVVMPTGGGKSLCYQIPALVMDGLTLVVSPLISLMKDQVDQLLANGVAAACLNSTQSREQQYEVMAACRSSGRIKMLYIAPERLMMDNMLEQLQQWRLAMIAVDEAHCISQWGHYFRPEYRALGQIKRHFATLPFLALTTTADEATRQDILRLLDLRDPLIQVSSFDRPNIRYTLVEKYKPFEQLWHFVRKRGKSGIIYCNSRSRVEDLSARLQSRGISVAAYHAGLENERRAQVQEAFQRDDLQVVVATGAFGMGINKPNVRFVLHFDIPRTIESYYQETGRAGRDSLPAEAILLYDPADMAWLRRCLEEKPAGQQQDIERHKLNAMGAFAEAQTCRRLVLLNYFGEGRQMACGNCDICLDPPKRYDGLEETRKALSCIYRGGQRFGMAYVVEVLRGANSQRIRENAHDRLPIYGIGRDRSNEHWISVLRQLIHLGMVSQNITQHSALQLTESARPVLRGEVALMLAEPRVTNLKTRSAPKTYGGNYDRPLFAKLRKLRETLADEANVPPYVVFNDATLLEMAEQLPTDSGQMLRINGVGNRKLERFGLPFLALIREHLSDEDPHLPVC